MKPILFALGSLVLSSASVFARLGETEAEIAARYGEPTTKPIDLAPEYKEYMGINSETARRTLTYQKDGLSIEICFIKGHSERETFSRETTDLSPEETQRFLELNSQGAQWKVVSKSQVNGGQPTPTGWELGKGTAYAELKEGVLSICSQKFKELEALEHPKITPTF